MLAQVQQILEEFEDYLPLTVRQIYYLLVGGYRYPKGKTLEETLGDLLNNARRARVIPFEHIRDDGIMGGGYWPPNLQTFLIGLEMEIRGYELDRQRDQPVRMQIWCEAAGMIPQLTRVADPYSIPVYSCSGFNSLPAIRQIVDAIVEERRDTVVLHLGDYDPSGESIFERVVTDVSAFLREDAPERSFEGVRVCLTEEQITEHNLTMDPITTKDTRSKAWIARGRTMKCELEALAPNLIATLLRERIEDYHDPEAWAETVDQERLERAALKSLPTGISAAREVRALLEEPLQLLYPSPARPG